MEAIKKFAKSESFGGVLLLFCAVIAMIVANSPLSENYFHLWHTKLGITINNTFIGMPLEAWINDVLMAFFFLVVGLEIKREMMYGELAGIKRAALPVIAALGGMIGPGIIYAVLNLGTESIRGFGIPMATDIAFALGVLGALGKKVPISVKVFLVSLAVADDLGAIIVIALFYSSGVDFMWLGIAGAIIALLLVLSRLGVKHLGVYMFIGVFLWIAVHSCGVHATIAAVALAFTIPMAPRKDTISFMDKLKAMLMRFEEGEKTREVPMIAGEQLEALEEIAHERKAVMNPAVRLEHTLAPYSNYLIMPIFAFANAGVAIGTNVDFGVDHVFLGIFLGLLLGKPLGIFLATFISVKIGLTQKPRGSTWIDVWGAGMLGGIGFTMSMFVTNLAFTGPHGEIATDVAKISILIASLTAGICGSLFFIFKNALSGNKTATA